MARETSSEPGKVISLPTGPVCFGPFRFDSTNVTLSRGDAHIHLPPRALGVLEYLVRRPGRLIPKDELLEAVWADIHVTEDALTQAVSLIRQALGDDPRDPVYVETVPRLGYRFVAELSFAAQEEARMATGPRPGMPTPLAPETELGKYTIVSRIGAGAMGEVWRARDSELRREVAIKVVPSDLAEDDKVLRRFRREARLLAQINHRHIATIHGVEEVNGQRFIVMEFLEGETLEERLGRGPLPIQEALEIGRQVALALEAAHNKGIVHRDLKPANVILKDGHRVKVLDFGLAKEVRSEGGEETSEQTSATKTGMMLGTAPYMSPEQVRGHLVDKRTDIWAFGCLLFELLTGQGASRRDTVADTLAAILDKEPDWTQLPDATPTSARRLLNRCLAKDPGDRLHDIADARIEVEEALSGDARATAGALVAGGDIRLMISTEQPAWRKVLPWSLAAIAAIITGISTWYHIGSPSPTISPSHVTIPVPGPATIPSLTSGYLTRPSIALSPDGDTLVYVAGIGSSSGGTVQLYLRPLNEAVATAIPIHGTERASSPFFSPDGQWIGFFADGRLKKVSVTGGGILEICEALDNRGASWGHDGTIVLNPVSSGGLWKVSAEGGEPQKLTTPDRELGVDSHRWPHVLPGGQAVLFTVAYGVGFYEAGIAVLDLSSGDVTELFKGGTSPIYVPTGHILFMSGDSLLAVPFDLDSLTVTGTRSPVRPNVSVSALSGAADFAVSNNGRLAYVSTFGQELIQVDRQNDARTLMRRNFRNLEVSPDGKRVAITIMEGFGSNISILDLERMQLIPFTTDRALELDPVWTPDGERITYRSDKDGPIQMYWKPVNGTGPPELLTASDHDQYPSGFSRDGSLLAYFEFSPDTEKDVLLLDVESGGEPVPLVATRFQEMQPVFSPDDRWLAYVSDESGQYEVWVRSVDGSGDRQLVSLEGGTNPRWVSNTNELTYHAGNTIMAVRHTTGSGFNPTPPEVVVELPEILYFDPFPDGESFLVVGRTDSATAPELNLVINWFEELKRLVPTGR